MALYKWLMVFSVVMLQACVAYHNKVTHLDTLPEATAYVYGVLYIRTTDSAKGLGAGLEIVNLDNDKVINLVFDAKYQTTLATIVPGNYAITKILYTNGVGKKKGETDLEDIPFTIGLNEAVYFGDIVVSADHASGDSALARHHRSAWQLDAIFNQFNRITEQLVAKHPEFDDLVKTNLILP